MACGLHKNEYFYGLNYSVPVFYIDAIIFKF